ncbi:MAG TPA: hypothetical protein VF556_07320 [Pyrinomonadaceae bacterium]|jgi:hypothetical protein
MIDLGLCPSDELLVDFVKVTTRLVFGELTQKIFSPTNLKVLFPNQTKETSLIQESWQ